MLELDAQDFQYDPSFPDVRTRRTNDFVLVETLSGTGRSVKVQKQSLSTVVERLTAQGFDTENLMVCFQDVPWENWSPAGGRVPMHRQGEGRPKPAVESDAWPALRGYARAPHRER